MKRLTVFLLVLVLVSGSCKDEEMFGRLVVTVGLSDINGQPIQSAKVALFDSYWGNSEPDALFVQPLIGNQTEFKELNPGNYRVVLLGTSYSQAVQVKAGKGASITIN